MVLNMYNKNKKSRECVLTFGFFGFSNQKMALFP
ncbi:hypothetical protein TSAR_005514 [Trichomalopsis sarcophagae]|uniref:Uncharacterized protein n=1 Tax=Trichomalopsis sarcophagae TaxID=543379 RepID=A0A232EYG9_9HYME|nr:hypothetical protein TSAR_005514 [Trichomalopsis sarcophagae]